MGRLFDDVKGYCRNLVLEHAGRDELFAEMEHMYLLQWPEGSSLNVGPIKLTLDPDPRNATQGAHRLLTVTEPKVKVPFDSNASEAKGASEAMEKAGLAMLLASGRIGGRPIHYDAALAGLLYSEVQILISRTKDIYERTEGASPAVRNRAKRTMMRTPYLFDVVNPISGYPVWDGLGLREYHRRYTTTVEKLIDEWGQMAVSALRSGTIDPEQDKLRQVQVCDYWDLTDRCVWIENCDQEIYLGPHELANIPVVATITEGTHLFDKPEMQRQPFLSTEYRSGMWNRKNLSLTALYTMVANYGLSPTFIHEKGNANSARPAIRQDDVMQYIQVEPGDKFYPMLNKGIIDPATIQALEVAERKTEESTMYKSALGGFLGGGSTYSTHALLSQLGRIPLETTRKMVGWAFGDALRVAFDWMREDGKGKRYQIYNKGVTQELEARIIPEFYEINVELDVALPQDRLSQSNIFNQLTGKVPDRYLVEDILGIGQYEEMAEELLAEQAFKAYSGAYMQSMVQMMQQAQAQQAQQAQAGPAGMMGAQGPGQMQGNPNAMLEGGNATGEGIPPELAAMMAQGGQGPGAMAQTTETGQGGGL